MAMLGLTYANEAFNEWPAHGTNRVREGQYRSKNNNCQKKFAKDKSFSGKRQLPEKVC
jgi:hypothetical protein